MQSENLILDFKWIKGYENIYAINPNGNVISNKKNQIKILKPVFNGNGYLHYSLYKNNKCVTITAHRLLAETFIPNPKNKPCINHIDGNKLNNQLSNLEWSTYSENNKHAKLKGLNKNIGEDHYATSLSEKDVIYMRGSGKSTETLSIEFNMAKSSIRGILNHSRWSHI